MDVKLVLAHDIEKIKEILGENLEIIIKADMRHQNGKLSSRHRLVFHIRECQDFLDGITSELPLISAIELGFTVQLFGSWQNSPIWGNLSKSLKNATDYPHLIILLAAAKQLGNSQVIYSEGNTRLPDLCVNFKTSLEYVVEIKTPKILQAPGVYVDSKTFDKLVERLVKAASPKKGGQLSPQYDSVLLIGGFHLSKDNTKDLVKAAERYFETKKRPKMIGIFILIPRVYLNGEVSVSATGVKALCKQTASMWTRLEFVQNQYYEGSVKLNMGSSDPLLSKAKEVIDPRPTNIKYS